jgi:2-desacetyl-2-hydroxyethyl bacteriochlorophyllide A dehydrogenase
LKGITRFGALVADRTAEVRSHEIPPVAPDELLVNNKACNICTFDYQQWLGDRPQQPYPMAFGHEDAGVVVEVGSAVQGFQVGDHVVSNTYFPCMQCSSCYKQMNMRLCEHTQDPNRVKNQFGYFGPYGCSEYKVMKSKHVLKIDKSISFEEACFTEPMATTIYGLNKMGIRANEKVLVIGAGSMGLLNAHLVRYFGGDVIISELMEKKLATAREMGFNKLINPADGNFEEQVKDLTGGKGPDAIVIAVGATKAYEQAFAVGPDMCRFLIFAAHFPAPEWDIDPNLVHYKLWEIYGTVGASLGDYQRAVDILAKKALNLEGLIEARYPLDDVQKAFEHATTVGSYRVNVQVSD